MRVVAALAITTGMVCACGSSGAPSPAPSPEGGTPGGERQVRFERQLGELVLERRVALSGESDGVEQLG